MLQRRLDITKWICCFMVLSCGPVWSPVSSVAVRTPEKAPSTVESQAKFFQDFFSVQLSPYKIEFGHVCEDPNTWEQRYEKKDFKNHRDMGKVRWGDKKGGYGEHYWDLNHAGHTGNHGSDDYDDGSYREDPKYDYHGTGDKSGKYESEEYDPDQSSHYDESGRAKRAHSKVKVQSPKDEEYYEEDQMPKPKRSRKNTEDSLKAEKKYEGEHRSTHKRSRKNKGESNIDENDYEDEDTLTQKQKRKYSEESQQDDNNYEEERRSTQKRPRKKSGEAHKVEIENKEEVRPLQKRPRKNREESKQEKSSVDVDHEWNETPLKADKQRHLHEQYEKESPASNDKKQIVLVVEQKAKDNYEEVDTATEQKHFVPPGDVDRLRKHQHLQAPSTTVPRLFLEPSTGRVIDRATGLAYVLQPVPHNKYI